MVQRLKDEVVEKIRHAALEIFFEKGFFPAKMTDIAKRADISVGNIYRYFKNKEVLFYSIIGEELVNGIKQSLSRKMGAIAGITPGNLDRGHLISLFDKELLPVILSHKKHTVILLRGSRGTRYEHFADELTSYLKKLLMGYTTSFSNDRTSISMETSDLIIEQSYKNFIQTLGVILMTYEDDGRITEAVHSLLQYHLYGILDLL